MTGSFLERLSEILTGNVAFLGIGNIDRADDAAGMVLARKLGEAGVASVFEGGVVPEKIVPALRDGAFNTVVLLDAVAISAVPGLLVILDAQELATKFPMVSTHKVSLGLLANIINTSGAVKVWLVGVQPQTIEFGLCGLSPHVEKTVHFAAHHIAEFMTLQVLQEQQTCI
jgi:hydrogenase maturation protease